MTPDQAKRARFRRRLETALAKVAHLMVHHDRPQFAPILRRLQHEIDKLDEEDAAMGEAMAILARQRTPSRQIKAAGQ